MATDKPAPTEYDPPWKEAIELYFLEFMAFFFADAFRQIDWSRGYTFLDKELQQVVRDAETGSRRVDKLVRVYLLTGGEIWMLIHIEVQNEPEAGFAQRMYIYNYRIFDKYSHPVASFAVLTDDSLTWRPDQFRYETLGCEVSLRFPVTKLLDYGKDWASLETNNNPFAVVVMAHLQTRATRHNHQARFDAKLTLCRMLFKRGYAKKDVLELLRFIDWLMVLPVELTEPFKEAVEQLDPEGKMRYVSTFEQLGMEKGLEKGLEKGIRESLFNVLEARFGEVTEEVAAAIESTHDIDYLKRWQRLAITVESLSVFAQHLANERPLITNN